MELYDEALEIHRAARGKLGIQPRRPLKDRHELSLQYTPGVAAVSRAIAAQPKEVWNLTNRWNQVAVVSNGTAVLGLGNIGPEAGLPVMEGKAILFKELADIDAIPLCLNAATPEEVIATVTAIAPSFGGINLEDIKAPECFLIERTLRDRLDIPVFHDDQHGTAVVLLAALINAVKVVGKSFADLRVAISGAGAAGAAIAQILTAQGVRHILVVDRAGILSGKRTDLNEEKRALLRFTNPENTAGDLADAMRGADVFIGVSVANLVTASMVRTMAKDPIVIAMANPEPEIMPDEAKKGGAVVVATGRSDFPNQVNNVLGFPSIFRGALDARATAITPAMELAAAQAIAAAVPEPHADLIIPDPLDRSVYKKVAAAVAAAVTEAERRTI